MSSLLDALQVSFADFQYICTFMSLMDEVAAAATTAAAVTDWRHPHPPPPPQQYPKFLSKFVTLPAANIDAVENG